MLLYMLLRTVVPYVLLVTSFQKQWKPKSCESSLMELYGFSQFPPLLAAYNKYMGDVDRLKSSQKI